ncbi:MAG TPA: class I SAM-dependent methyltransferase [Methanospirillum sp.]|uniref:class I SAM-dependent methyltransferase n=1 Tax=Methanospirillum sp. TaxID=45200 RepID=UPI002C8D1067|nr:class I SAM-dependent methyltransferase [Methanospirillum sp.]HOJ97886.1 class I SAM-dependent methyltransferase [Methanospirillum sp.]
MSPVRSDYQEGYSRINPAVLDKNGRRIKAEKIQTVLNTFYPHRRVSGMILDLGCSGGVILHHLTGKFDLKIGTDIDIAALKIAKRDYCYQNIEFICADGMNLPFKRDMFQYIICNHVYEHVPDSKRLFREIFRALIPGGVCYCAAGNALAIMEAHYHLPFLSWLPKRLAHRYIQVMNRGDSYYENHLTWWSFKKIISLFKIHDYTIQIIRHPELFVCSEIIKPGSWITRMPEWIWSFLFPFIPTWILILEKPNGEMK